MVIVMRFGVRDEYDLRSRVCSVMGGWSNVQQSKF